jgi:7-cyano-7-deazaguanine synthase
MSGGLDSTTLAFRAIHDGFTILPINIKYNQKNKIELQSFNDIFDIIKESFPDQVLDPIVLDLQGMLKTTLDLFQSIRDKKEVEDATGMEFYTPSRNLVFTTLAAMVGEVAAIAGNIKEIKVGLGVHKHETYTKDYWDISPEFVEALDNILNLNDCVDINMYAPYADKFKADIVKDAVKLKVPIFSTWTCYNPQEIILHEDKARMQNFIEYQPCMKCEACVERQKAGDEADFPNINNYIQEGWAPIVLGKNVHV